MVVLRATLPFALCIFIIGNQALLERNQESPAVDNGDPCSGCKKFGNDQIGEDNAVTVVTCYFNLHILNSIKMLKHLLTPSKSDQDVKPSKPIFESQGNHLTSK